MINKKIASGVKSLLILIILISGGCGNRNSVVDAAAYGPYCIDESFRDRVEFAQVKQSSVSKGIPLTGVVESDPGRVVQYVSLVDGMITRIYYSHGDKVRRGQLLAELSSTELNSMQSEKRSLESQVLVAKQNYNAVKSMHHDGIASRKDLLLAESELETLKAEIEKVNRNLSFFSGSVDKGVFQIKSPIDGIITHNSIAPGVQISANSEPLFTVSDLNTVWVMVNIYASNLVNVYNDMPVAIRTLSYQDKVFEGSIQSITHVFDSESRVLKARIVLPNPELLLKPGMLVDVVARKDLKTEALMIPTSSMVFDNNRNYVIVYRDDCDIVVSEVEIISEYNGSTFVSGGLSEKDRVITRNHLLIYEQIKNYQNY